MGAIRDQNSLEAIQAAIVNRIRLLNPALDTNTGTVLRDIVIDAPAAQMRSLAVLLDYADSLKSVDSLLAILDDPDYLSELNDALPEFSLTDLKAYISSDLDRMASNFLITRTAAQPARYRQRFWRADDNNESPITVPLGTQVQTLDGSVKARVVASSAQTPVVDVAKGLYYVEATIEATTSGTIGNVANNAFSRFSVAIPTLASETGNVEMLQPGTDIQSDASLGEAIKNSFRARNLNTKAGYKEILKAAPLAFTDVSVVGPNDSLMKRSASGAVDLYVIGSDTSTRTDVFRYQTGTTQFLLTYQPALSLVSVTTGAGPKPTNSYTLLTSNNGWSGSAKAKAYFKITDASTYSDQQLFNVTYTYDAKIRDAQNLIESPDYDVPGADVLVKRGTQVLIDMDLQAVLTGSVSESVAQTNMAGDFAKFFTGGVSSTGVTLPGRGMGVPIDKTDVLSILTAVNGVDRITLTTLVIYTVIGGIRTISGTDPIPVDASQYARAGTLNFLA